MKNTIFILILATCSQTFFAACFGSNQSLHYEGDLVPESLELNPNFSREGDLSSPVSTNNGILTIDGSLSSERLTYGLDTDSANELEFAFSFSARAINTLDTTNSTGGVVFWWGGEGNPASGKTTLYFTETSLVWEKSSPSDQETFAWDGSVFNDIVVYRESESNSVNLMMNDTILSSIDISRFTTSPGGALFWFNESNSITEWDYVRSHMGEGALDIVQVPEVSQFTLCLIAGLFCLSRRQKI